MIDPLFLAIFATMIGITLVWFVLVKLLFNRLEQRHAQKYAAMGRPSLFLRNSPSGTLAMLKFLVLREYRVLNDDYLSKLSSGMLIVLVVYSILFLGLLVQFYFPWRI